MGGIGKNVVKNKQSIKVEKSKSQPIEYSDVDSRTTPMSDRDKDIISTGVRRYFQSSYSFQINSELRRAADEDNPNASIFNNLTVQTMDKVMKPTNKDMDVVRLADGNYLTKVLKNAGITDSALLGKLDDAASGWGRFTQSDVNIINDALQNTVINENAFMSTTYNKSLSDSAFTRRKVKIAIKVNAGTKGVFSPTGKESEFVLDRKTGYAVHSVTLGDDGRLVFNAETI